MRVEVSLETAAARIRTWEPLRDETLNLAPFPSLATAARPRSPRGVEKDSLRIGRDEDEDESVSRRRQSAGAPWERYMARPAIPARMAFQRLPVDTDTHLAA